MKHLLALPFAMLFLLCGQQAVKADYKALCDAYRTSLSTVTNPNCQDHQNCAELAEGEAGDASMNAWDTYWIWVDVCNNGEYDLDIEDAMMDADFHYQIGWMYYDAGYEDEQDGLQNWTDAFDLYNMQNYGGASVWYAAAETDLDDAAADFHRSELEYDDCISEYGTIEAQLWNEIDLATNP